MAVALREGRELRGVEAIAERPDGSRVTFLPFPSLLRDDEGEVVGAVNMLIDISDRKQTEHRLRLLSGEVNHRANNLLSVVQAIVRMTRSDSVHGFRNIVEGRIRALAQAHKLLADTRWGGTDLHELALSELGVYSKGASPRIHLIGPKLLLPPMLGQTIAITLHELTTNSAKYGALSSPIGCVELKWLEIDGVGLSLSWKEASGPLVTPPTHRGFGTRVIDQMIRQLNGIVSFDWQQSGLSCEIILPL